MSIKTDAEIIRDETVTGANTATRVGGNLVAIADDLVAKQSDIDTNNDKVSYSDASQVSTNTSDISDINTAQGVQDTAIGLNTAKTGITTTQANNIVANNAKVGVTVEEANPSVVPQAEAETGTATTERTWTAERVKQAIVSLGGSGGGASTLPLSSTITTSRDALLTDADGANESTSVSDITVTIPLNSSVAFPIGSVLLYKQNAAGSIIIDSDGGVTLTGGQTYSVNQTISVWKTGTDTWELLNPPILDIETDVAANNAKIGVTNEPSSDPTGVTGADAITNMMSLTQVEYDAIITPNTTTLYVING